MLIKIIYLALSGAMFYFTQGAIEAGGFGFMYRYLFGMGIIAMGFFSFLVHPNMERAKKLFHGFLIVSAAYIVTVLWSTVIWISTFAEFRTMTRGFFFPFYQILSAATAVSTLYMFGKKGIWYCLGGMCIGNSVIILQTIAGGGLGTFIEELVTLLTTFGEQTGALMHEVEVHDLTFAFGSFAVFLVLDPHLKKKGWWAAFLATMLFMVVGLKRIEVGAVILAVIVCWPLKYMQSKTAKKIAFVFSFVIILCTFAYIIAIHAGLFDYLEAHGMDTKGRNGLYRYLNTQYSISPSFMGRGLGFSNTAWDLSGVEWIGIKQDAYHNEFLRMYIEVGFVGYVVWFLMYLPVRLGYVWKHGGQLAGVLTLAYSIYCMITYATDNTLYYFYTNLSMFILILYELMGEEENGTDKISAPESRSKKQRAVSKR